MYASLFIHPVDDDDNDDFHLPFVSVCSRTYYIIQVALPSCVMNHVYPLPAYRATVKFRLVTLLWYMIHDVRYLMHYY